MATAGLTDECLFATIDESAKNTRQMLYVYLGLISYAAITVIGASDRELVLNGTVRLPIVDANIQLSLFYFLCPALVMLSFTHLQLHIIELKHLLMQVADPTTLEQRVYPWLLVRALLLLNRKIPKRFGDRLGIALTVTSAYLSLPLMLAIFAISYARTHAPVLTYLLALLPPLGCAVALGFFIQVLDLSLRDLRRKLATRPLSLVLAALALVGALTPAWELAVVVIYLIPFVLPLSLALLLAAPIAAMLERRWGWTPPHRAARSLLAASGLLFHTIVCIFVSALVHDHSGATTALIGLVIALHLYGSYVAVLLASQRRLPVAPMLVGIVLVASSCIFHLVWLSNKGEGLSLDLSHQNLVGERAADGAKTPVTPIDLQWAHLEGAKFSSAVLTDALLNKAFLRNADFSKARLDGADLSGADLSGATFNDASMRGVTLNGPAPIEHARFENARLDGATVSDLDLRYVYLKNARFDGASLVGVSLNESHDLTAAQVLAAGKLSYSYMSEAIERKVISAKPALLFSDALMRFDSHEEFVAALLQSVPEHGALSRERLCERGSLRLWHPSAAKASYRTQAQQDFACANTLERLQQLGVLKSLPDGSFEIADTALVRDARALQHSKPQQ
ncbi:hypothetical protein GJ699_09370 [Duganella sp. FT80W]|uniref:Pentapeptide repeat-containing protein n=1 Tax=Duganella guangzhouensis TaxID=2666084 RepID=A0A6I2KXB0_9BURK|nr:pentapeptide repeat-containing protein [Duganella guangzhouensis]MRW90192.1 hypothetical protein [Duganella guangzhouensis]